MKKEHKASLVQFWENASKEKQKDVLFKIVLDPVDYAQFKCIIENRLIKINYCSLREAEKSDGQNNTADKYRNPYYLNWHFLIDNLEKRGEFFNRSEIALKNYLIRQEQTQTMRRKYGLGEEVQTLRTEKQDRHLILISAPHALIKPLEEERFFFEFISSNDDENFRFYAFPIKETTTPNLSTYNTFNPITRVIKTPHKNHEQTLHEVGEEKREEHRKSIHEEDLQNAHSSIKNEFSDDESNAYLQQAARAFK